MSNPLDKVGVVDANAVAGYLVMVERSLGTIDPVKRDNDPDVQMLLSHVTGMLRRYARLTKELYDAQEREAGLRAELAARKV